MEEITQRCGKRRTSLGDYLDQAYGGGADYVYDPHGGTMQLYT